ncbi:uncharacterized protein BT62DRAFT_1011383 [Guyanagaster necrorhizus]|uniref:Uncharacterized protein n=1 Tax=Guyanagaster necrorhizus TaxID=856835 RepID=A0A9P7VJ19_9AGAR|nr:uncharacterized protein BT62DRAFT_1011383 [Guyanagaster necrorhizus MCA 3950]KAG7441579.1 hypothetical protein BT62DRAFT_1011383 [Guyanagaster necrorhizus MCA 3950]
MAAGAFRAEGRGNLSSPDLPLGGQLDFAIKGGGVDGGAERVSTAGIGRTRCGSPTAKPNDDSPPPHLDFGQEISFWRPPSRHTLNRQQFVAAGGINVNRLARGACMGGATPRAAALPLPLTRWWRTHAIRSRKKGCSGWGIRGRCHWRNVADGDGGETRQGAQMSEQHEDLPTYLFEQCLRSMIPQQKNSFQ